ncbi:hypothetical protein CsSME_00003778 [Camellia sinensis var. sinensis]
MAGSLVGGAALGAAFGELLRAVDNGIINAVQFKSTLTSLRSRLNQISPMLEEIDNLNRKLGRSEQDTEMFTNRLKEGLHFVNKCEKIHWWNCCKKSLYTIKLKDLEQSIVTFFQIEAQAQMSMDSRRILVVVNEVDEKLERMNTFGGGGWGCIPWPKCSAVIKKLKIVRGCGGFPLALEVVGKSLKGESEVTWNNRLNRWSEGQSIFYSDAAPNGATDLLNRLQTTLDDLDVKIKECYLDLAAFPEDQRIPAMALVDMWAELYNLDEVSAFANIHELSDRNLLNLVPTRKDANEINGYYNEHFVTQHDLLREVATRQIDQNPIHQSRLIMDISGNDLPKWWIEQGQHPIRLVSISTGEISNGHNMQLSKVEVLLLNIQIRNYTLPQLMEKMDQLKVLIVTNYGFGSAEISNFPLLGHLSSLKRIRFEHISISSIAKTMLRLKNLQKISLVMCKFDDAFGNCTIQIADMLPNLVEIVIDCCNDLVEFPAWLCNISSLKRLNITNCHELIALPEAFGKLDNLEVLRLHACTKLLELPESIGRLQKFRFLDLSDCISISKLTERMGELSSLRKLNMRGCRGLSELPSSVKNLRQLEDLICDEETGYLWENYKIHLPNLKFHVLKEDVNLDWLK